MLPVTMVTLTQAVTCAHCQGQMGPGQLADLHLKMGQHTHIVTRGLPDCPAAFWLSQGKCPACRGLTTIIHGKSECPRCLGTGRPLSAAERRAELLQRHPTITWAEEESVDLRRLGGSLVGGDEDA